MASQVAAAAVPDIDAVRAVLVIELGLNAATARGLARDSALFGDLPELDSMAVARVLTAIEDRFDFVIDDDEVDGDLFETLGSLSNFVSMKRGEGVIRAA